MRTRHVLPNFRIAVVGAGAIGSYYGGKLAHFGRDVHFLLRSDYQVARERGLRLRSKGENIHIRKINAHNSPNDIGPCDLVLVAVKTTANPQLPPLIAPLLGEKTMILTLQNGLGNEEFLA
ncbi:MAG TPA: 2-dehydropantoate 2-reductase N-terminal domain-containing protein, partial [Chthoniobacterales bacterium]